MRVLVVEDDRSVAAGVERCLSDDGYEVQLVHDGGVALELLGRETFNLIVLDILLPGVNGYKLCESLRSGGDGTPILMLTAKSGEYDEAEGLELGADDFLTKPFSTVVLRARVRALLRRPGRRGEWPSVGCLRLDPVRRRCLRDTTPIALSARELELLALLLERSGEVVGKSVLSDAVWGPGFRGDPNIVEVYIARLRRKIDEPFGSHMIETVRGAGYRLRAVSASAP